MPSPIGRKLPSGPGAWRKPPEKDAAGHPAASATSAAAATVLQNVFPNGKANDDVVLNFNREVDALVASHDKPDCNKEIFTIHIQNPKTKTSRTFRVSAEVPTGTSYDNAKDMWRIAIARKLHLIGNRETAKATVYDNCISYEINGKEHTDGDAEVAAVCSAYVSGDNSALRAALPAFERTIPSSRAAAPLYNTNPAPFLRWHNNNCYMQDALQDLLANPLLLEKLPTAIACSENTPEEKAFLTSLKNFADECASQRPASIPVEQTEAIARTLAAAIRNQNGTLADRLVRGEMESAAEIKAAIRDRILREDSENNLEHIVGLEIQEGTLEDAIAALDAEHKAASPAKELEIITGGGTWERDGVHSDLARSGHSITVPCTHTVNPEHYTSPGDEQDRTYQLSAAQFHDRAHFWTVIRKPNSEGGFTSYLRGKLRANEKDSQPMTDEQCNEYLEKNAAHLVSCHYFQDGIQQDGIQKSKEVARTAAASAGEDESADETREAAPTAGTNNAVTNAPGTGEIEIKLASPDGTTHLFSVVSGDINDTTKRPLVVNFTASNSALSPKGLLPRTPKAIVSPDKSREMVSVNPGTSLDSLIWAVWGALECAKEQYKASKSPKKISFPLPHIEGQSKLMVLKAMEAAIANFAEKNPYALTIEIVVGREDLRLLEELHPERFSGKPAAQASAPAAAAKKAQTEPAKKVRTILEIKDARPDNLFAAAMSAGAAQAGNQGGILSSVAATVLNAGAAGANKAPSALQNDVISLSIERWNKKPELKNAKTSTMKLDEHDLTEGNDDTLYNLLCDAIAKAKGTQDATDIAITVEGSLSQQAKADEAVWRSVIRRLSVNNGDYKFKNGAIKKITIYVVPPAQA